MKSASRVSRFLRCPRISSRRPLQCLLSPVVLTVAPAIGATLNAQTPSAQPAECVPRVQVVDSLLNIVSAVVEVTDGHGRGPTRLPLAYLNLIVEEIASRVQVPSDVGGGVLVPMPYSVPLGNGDTMHVAAPVVRASLAFTLHPDGHLDSVGLWGSALNAALEDAVFSAIVATDSAGAIPRFPTGVEAHALLMRLTVEPEQFWKEQPAAALTTRSELRPLFRTARPLVRVTAVPVRGASTITEEDDFRRNPPRDTIRFVVSAEGIVLPETVSVSRVSYLEAGASALTWIMRARFRPGRIGDCPVPMVVHVPMR